MIFSRDGYVSLPGFFDSDEITEIRENKERFVRDVVPTMPETEVYYDDKDDRSTLKQLQGLSKRDDFFAAMVAPESKLATLAEVCLAEPVRLANLQYFNKSPNASTPTPPHQDGYYFSPESEPRDHHVDSPGRCCTGAGMRELRDRIASLRNASPRQFRNSRIFAIDSGFRYFQ